jgi:hypothetical protein
MIRWRGRRLAGVAVVILLAASTGAGIEPSGGDAGWWVVIRDGAGDELARTPLPASRELALRYRNSLYHSIAEEHFVAEDGRLSLVALAADELAVLEEYYTAVGGTRSDSEDGLRWHVGVERPAIELPLSIRATALGERTLITAGREIPLWRLVVGRDATLVTLSVERSR